MKRHCWTPDSPHQSLRLAIATASLLSMTAAPTIANAAGYAGDATPSSSGVYVTILSPNPGTAISGAKQIEISAYYESQYGVSAVDLFIDGRRMATQHLTSPETRGEISFMVDPEILHSGSHNIVVRATATDAEVASARTSLTMPGSDGSVDTPAPVDVPQTPDASAPQDSSAPSQSGVGAPNISVVSPVPQETVSGVVRIKVNATDPSGKSPYVSLFVDHAFKTLRNFAPYSFDWDTTRLANGPHTIEVWGYNDAQQVGQSGAIRVLVNNPGGHTFERHDLSDFTDAAPTATRPTAATPAVAAAPKVVQPAAARMKPLAGTKRGVPLIAQAVRQTVSGMLAKADILASAKTDGSIYGGSVDDGLMTPIIAEQDVPHLVPTARTNAQILRAVGSPSMASANAQFKGLGADAHYVRMASAALNDLGSADLDATPTAPQLMEMQVPHLVTQKDREVPHLAPIMPRSMSATRVTGAPVVAGVSASASAPATRGVMMADNTAVDAMAPMTDLSASPQPMSLSLRAVPVAPRATVVKRASGAPAVAGVSATVAAPAAHGVLMADGTAADAMAPMADLSASSQPVAVATRPVPVAKTAHAASHPVQIASARIAPDAPMPSGAAAAPKVDIAKIAAEAAAELPAINKHEMTLGSLSVHQRNHLTGTYEVMVDNQPVAMDRPLQSKGSVLFAPLRQIFQSEGGELTWNKAKQQVHAISPSRIVLLTIGSKKAIVNNHTVAISAAPYLLTNRTMLPLSALPVALNMKVTFDAASGHLEIESR